ncbi:MAG: hypothetical protein FWF85_03990 [Clostridiales bacterium]|nr:hypothetical protein [Clostridiales bacterium]
MKKTKPLLPLLAGLIVMALVTLLSFSAVFAAEPNGLAEMPDPIDPQSWTMPRDTNWSNFVPNPVIDWMTEQNPASVYNPSRWAGGRADLGIPEHRNTPINGAIILVDFFDKPFLMLGEKNTDLFGWHTFAPFDTYKDYLNKIERGDPVTKNPQRVVEDEAALLKFWEDFLNKKITDPANNASNFGSNIDEFWREVSYGKWNVDLKAFGPYHLQGLELEYGHSYVGSNDQPPSLRRSGGARNLISDSIALANADNVYIGDYDFFFVLHSGYDQSGVWMEFGQLQWADGKDVPYEYGPKAKMDELEILFTENPQYVLSMAGRGGYSNTTLSTEADKIRAHQTLGTLSEYEFKFPAADWTWANSYTGQDTSKPGTAGGSNTSPTRYVRWTSWAAGMTKWASSSGYGGTTVRNSLGFNVPNIPYSQQAECNGMATYTHEFGHIVNLPDNYSAPFSDTVSARTEPWDLMSRGCFAGPFGDHARWSVPGGLEADSAPVHLMFVSKKFSNFYDPGDIYELSVANLKSDGPVVKEVVARNIPMNNAGHYPQLENYGLIAPNFYKAIELNFDSANPDRATLVTTGWSNTRTRATRMSIEVVERTGYDSYAPDDGVLISRLTSGSGSYQVVDSHLDNRIQTMTDYYLNGASVGYPIAHQVHLMDATFKAGKSFTDTGYYVGGEYKGDIRGIAGDVPVKSEIVSGNTVNEYYDSANKLHYYILDRHDNPGKVSTFLSYSIGILHEDGPAVGGDLVVKAGKFEAADPGRVATQWFTVTNTGDATDIIRVGADCALDFTLLNDLYAVEAGQTIEIPVYVGIPATDPAFKPMTFTASSESNAGKAGAASVTDFSANINAPVQIYVKEGNKVDYVVSVVNVANEGANLFTIEAAFDAKNLNYAGYTFGPSLLTHSPAQGSFSYDVVNGKLTLDMHLGRPGVLIKAETETPLVTFHFTLKDGVAAGPDATVLDTFLSKVTGYCFIAGKSSPIDAIITKPGAPTKVLIHPLGYEGGELDEATISWLIYHHLYKTDLSSDWDDIKKYDLNGNGMIDLADIVALWSLIGK